MCKYKVGNFWVLPLKVPHGECECFAYHINLPDGRTLLFCTDAETFPYSIKGVNNLLIEANYSTDIIIDRMMNGNNAQSQFTPHMELNETINVIRRLRNPQLDNVILLHMSSGNSDEDLFKERIFQETGFRCIIAESGLKIDLDEDF